MPREYTASFLALDPVAGKLHIAGTARDPGTDQFDIMTWESDLDGTIQTANRFDGPLHRGESPTDAALDHRGNLYLAGISNSYGSGYDYILLKFGVVTRLELPEYRRRESFEITLVGERERIYEIEVSDDLQLWSRLTTVANTFGRTVVLNSFREND